MDGSRMFMRFLLGSSYLRGVLAPPGSYGNLDRRATVAAGDPSRMHFFMERDPGHAG